MRTTLLTILILPLFLATFQFAHAQTTDRAVLVARMQSLLTQLRELQAELAARQESRVLGISTRRLTPSRFYDGPYEAIYFTSRTSIVPYGPTQPRTIDRDLWELWRDVVGDQAIRQYITEFRIYDDPDAEYDAFIEQIGTSDDWIFGVNLAPVDLTNRSARLGTAELFIHEYAHLIFFYNPRIATAFEDEFWRPRSRDVDDYVSDYAMLDTEEDFAESFTYFVLERQPDSNGEAAEKVDFFDEYRFFRELRTDIRNRLF